MDKNINEDLEKCYNINQIIGKGSFVRFIQQKKKIQKKKGLLKYFNWKIK